MQLKWRPAKEEIDPKLPLQIPLAFTVRGEACKDECKLREGYSYKWCTKLKSSNLGSWTDNDYCTTDSSKYGITLFYIRSLNRQSMSAFLSSNIFFLNQLHHQAEKGAPVNADLKDIPMHGATLHHPGDTVHQSPS